MNNKILLIIASLLILLGLFKPDLSNIIPHTNKNNISVVLEAPSDEVVLKECEEVTSILKNGDPKDSIRLRDLYIDIANLIDVDGEDMVIKGTEDIRQANGLAGAMLKLDIKGKYANLASATKEVIISVIGDDNVMLSPELRKQASQSFRYLAWACNEGAK